MSKLQDQTSHLIGQDSFLKANQIDYRVTIYSYTQIVERMWLKYRGT